MSDQFQDIRFGSETMTAAEVRNLLNAKQDRLTVDGTQLVLNGNRLSITNTPTREEFRTAVNAKQDKLVAGENIKIEGTKISAVVPKPTDSSSFATQDDLTNLKKVLMGIINEKQFALSSDNAGQNIEITRDSDNKVTISSKGLSKATGRVVIGTRYNESSHKLENIMGDLIIENNELKIKSVSDPELITQAVQETVAQ